MAVSPISPKILQTLMTFIKSNITEEQLEEGYALFRRPGSVEWLHADSARMTAICNEGDDSFDVEIIPAEAEPFSCSCGETMCLHGLAVFLQLLRLTGKNPEMFLAECNIALNERERRQKQKKTSTEVLLDQPPASKVVKANKAAHKSAKRTALPAFPQPGDSSAVWRNYFHERYRKVLVTPRPSAYLYGLESQIISFNHNIMEEMTDESAQWPTVSRGLFMLHAQLYAMETIDRYLARLPFSPGHYLNIFQLARELAQSTFEDTEEILSLLDMNEVLKLHDDVWKEALDILRQNTFKANASRQDWAGLYRSIWSRISIAGDWAAEERAWLDNLFYQEDNQNLKNRIRWGLALFDFFSGDDEAALAKLTADPSLSRNEYEPLLKELYRYGVWSRLLVWLQGLKIHLKRDRYFLDQIIFPVWLEGAEAQPDEPGWISWIKEMLPQSQEIYISYLIRNGEARKVAHMLLSEGYPLYYIDKPILKLLEQTDLRLVLPLYHQDAERYILEKNRQSYKQAVRLLKKLAGFYKKLKEQDRWQAYLEQLAARFSRLRAFQEELRKGKLIV